MPYIVKSSLDIGGKIIPWNEQEANKLIKEKEKMLEKKLEIQEEVNQDAKIEENASYKKQDAPMQLKEEKTEFKRNKKKEKVGE